MMRSVARRRSPPIWKLRARRSPRSPTPRARDASFEAEISKLRAEKEKASTARDELERARRNSWTPRRRVRRGTRVAIRRRDARVSPGGGDGGENVRRRARRGSDAARDELAAAVASNAAREEEALAKLREKETKLATLAEVTSKLESVVADAAESSAAAAAREATLEDEIARLREKMSAMSSEMEAKDAAVARTTCRGGARG